MSTQVTATIFFTDSTEMTLSWPRQAGDDAATIAMNVKKGLEQDKLAVEVDGQLLVIPMNNIKYVQISPAPSDLPQGVLKNAHLY